MCFWHFYCPTPFRKDQTFLYNSSFEILLFCFQSKNHIYACNCDLWTMNLWIKFGVTIFTFILHKFLNIFLHNSQKCITFAFEIETMKFSYYCPLNLSYYEKILWFLPSNAKLYRAFVCGLLHSPSSGKLLQLFTIGNLFQSASLKKTAFGSFFLVCFKN